MSTLSQLAADLAYAGGQGAKKIEAEVTRSGKITSELGVHLPGGSGLFGATQAASTGADAGATADAMAVQAAEAGAKLILRGAQ